MLSALKNRKVISIYKPEEFPVIDNEKLSAELDVKAAARQQAKKELPASKAKSPDSNEINYRNNFQTQLIQKSHSVQKSLNDLSNQIHNLSINQQLSDTKSAPNEFEQTVHTELTVSKRELKDLKNKLDLADEDLEQFKSENKLNREADYPLSKLKTFGLLFFLMLIEAIANGFFFAEGSDSGLLGGIVITLAIAFVNISFGFLLGWMVIRYKNHITKWKSNLSLVSGFAVFLLVSIGNLFIAHYREALSNFPDNAQEHVWKSIESGWFSVADISSWLLFLVGIFFFILSTYKGYKCDDEYPGYGKFARLRDNASEELLDEKNSTISLIDEKYDEAMDILEDSFEDIKKLNINLTDAISSFEIQNKIFKNYCRHAESSLTYITKLYRDINSAERESPPPNFFEDNFDFKLNFEPLKFDYKDKRNELVQAKEDLELNLPSLREKLNITKKMFHDEVDEVCH